MLLHSPLLFQFESCWLFADDPLHPDPRALARSPWQDHLSAGLDFPQPGWPSFSLALSLAAGLHRRLLLSLWDLLTRLCNNGKKEEIWAHLLRSLASSSCRELRHTSICLASSLSAGPPCKADTLQILSKWFRWTTIWFYSSAVRWIASFHESHKPSFSLFADPPIVIRAFLCLTYFNSHYRIFG